MKNENRRTAWFRRRKRRKFIRAAVKKAVAQEVKLEWSDYYPACPECGSREVQKIGGKVWNYCPECGQRLKGVETTILQNGGYEGERMRTK